MKRRPVILLVALVATLAATWWASRLEDEGATQGPAQRAVRSLPAGAGGQPVPPQGKLTLARETWPAPAADIMRPYSFRPELPHVSTPAAAPSVDVEGPPPLPFRFLGTLEEKGLQSVVLMEGPTVYVLRVGQDVDQRYRVERITPTQILFTYMPLRQRQSLEIAPSYDPSR